MPQMWMDVDTALSEVPVNLMPLIDDTDFKTIETGVVYNSAGMDLRWNFVTTAGATTSTAVTPTTAGVYDWTHQGDGMYTIEIPASGGASINNDTEGFGWFSGVATGILPWRGPVIGFRAAAINNALIDGGDNLDVNTVQVGGQTASATGAVDFDDLATIEGLASGATGFAAIDTVVDGIKAVTDNLPESGALTTIDANIDAILVDTGATIPALFPTNFADLAITATTGLVSVGTNNDKTGYSLTSSGLSSVTAWTVAITGNITGNLSGSVGSVTGNVGGNVVGSVANVTGGINTAAGTITTLDALDTAQDSQHSTTQSNIAALNDLSAADVNAEVDTALADYDGPTKTEMDAAFTEIKGATWASGTDTLEAIRDRGDAAWTTGAGGTPPDLLVSTTISVLSSQTVFRLTAGSADNDAYNGAIIIVTDSATSTQKAVGQILDYAGPSKQVTLAADPGIFTMAVGDTVDIIAATGTGPTAAAIRAEIDSNSTQLAAILADTAEIGTAGAGLSNIPWNAAWDAEVQSECADALTAYSVVATTDLPANFADLAITVTTGLVSVGSLANDSIAEATFQAGAITSSVLDASAITANNIATGAITSAKIATDAIGSAQLAASAVTEIQTGLATSASISALNDPTAAAIADAVWDEVQTGHTTAGTFGYYLDARVSTAGGGGLTAGAIADAVWTEAIADHSGTSGSTAEQLAAAGAGGDPWATALPGAYTTGQAGKIIGDRLDATVSSRAATGVTVVTRSHTASTISIIRGDDYDGTAQDAFTWDAGKNIDGGSVTFTIRDAFDDSSIFTTSGSASGTTVTVSLTDVQTLTLPIGTHKFDVQLTLSGGQIQTVAFGDVTVIEDQTRA